MKQDWRLIALVVLIVCLTLASQCEAAKGKGKGKDKDGEKDDDESKDTSTTAAPEGGEGGAENDAQRQSSRARKCKEKCRNVDNVVCGTDFITYQNKCLLTRAACETEKKITVRNKGKCPPDQDSKKCPLSCRGVPDKPICDQSGKLHDNLCQFKMDQCGFPRRKVYHENSDFCVKQPAE